MNTFNYRTLTIIPRCSHGILFSLFLFGSTTSIWAQSKSSELFYEQAIAYFNEANREKGYELLNRALADQPDYYEALYAKSYYLLEDEEYEQAILIYDSLLFKYPEKSELYLYRGRAHLYQADFERAELDYLRAWELDSSNTETNNALGGLYFIIDLYKDAIHYFNKILKIDSKNFFAQYYRAYSFYLDGDFRSARLGIEACLQTKPGDADARLLKAQVMIAQRQYKGAIELFEEMSKENLSMEIDDFYYWGLAYFRQKKYQDALFYFQLPESPQDSRLSHYSAKALFYTYQLSDALLHLDEALSYADSLDEATAALYYDRAIIRQRLKNPEGAKDDFLYANYLLPEIYQQNNQKGKIPDLIGNAYLSLKAEKYQKEVDSIRVLAFQERAESQINQGQVQNALLSCNQALLIDSLNPYSYTLKGITHGVMGRFPLALEDIEKAMQISSSASQEKNHYIKGLIYGQLQVYPRALAHLDTAIGLNKQQAVYYSDRGHYRSESGDLGGAFKDIQTALEMEPDNPNFLVDRSYYYYKMDSIPEAIADCNRVLEGNSYQLLALYNRALAYEKQEKWPLARQDYARILEILPKDADVLKRMEYVTQAIETNR